MVINLPPELERFVAEQVEAGHYQSAQELIIAALLDMRDVVEDELDDQTVAAINKGLEQAERGEGIDFDEYRAKWDARLRKG